MVTKNDFTSPKFSREITKLYWPTCILWCQCTMCTYIDVVYTMKLRLKINWMDCRHLGEHLRSDVASLLNNAQKIFRYSSRSSFAHRIRSTQRESERGTRTTEKMNKKNKKHVKVLRTTRGFEHISLSLSLSLSQPHIPSVDFPFPWGGNEKFS